MSTIRDIIRGVTWRVGRRLYCAARFEQANDPRRNGEYWLLEHVSRLPYSMGAAMLDVGANVGMWTSRAAVELQRNHQPTIVHSFEPAAATFATLALAVAGRGNVVTHNLALSDRSGVATFYVSGENLGTNSFQPVSGAATQMVATATID